MKRVKNKILIVGLLVALLSSCSTTSRLPEGEILYTGVKKIAIEKPEGVEIPSGLSSEIRGAVNVKPNNSLYSPYYRYPLPIGLWVWNHWDEPKGGFKHWLYEKLVEEPVLISDVRPEVRTAMITQVLHDNGYFRGTSEYSLDQGKNRRKARILYTVNTGPEYLLDSIELFPDTCRLYHLADSVALRSRYLRAGSRYSVDSLAALRVNIANALRNRGYYFFRPEYIEYLADSLQRPEHISLRMTIGTNTPKWALQEWRTGTITTHIYRVSGEAEWTDTTETRRGTIIRQMPSHLREGLIENCVTFRTGRIFSVRDMDRTQTYLSRLSIFNGIEINAIPDTTASVPTLNVDINCTFDRPLEATIEVNASSKSNSYLGPGIILGLTNKNLFGGGEQFSVQFTGSYEWQTGRRRRGGSLMNSYEFGLTTSLAFPRLLAPSWVTRRRRVLNWTRISLGAEVLNRPRYFRLAQFNAGITYDWQYSRHVSNSLTLFKLSYNKLIHTTSEFDSIMNNNQAIALSFRDQYIPQISWTYTYDTAYRTWRTLNFQLTLQEAGNVFWSIYQMAGQHGEKRLFGTPFSQFIKGTAQLVVGQRLCRKDIWLVCRALVGAAHAYGNSSQVPYSEQFYIGGANSIRAFTVRSLGPGSFRPGENIINGYFDQTGTFKLEFNAELRFPILGQLHGATFIDAGNIWLLKADPQRPGGTLRASTFWKEIALGTGFGLRFDISMLVLRADLGIGIHAPYDTGKRGYYNMAGSFWRSLAFHLAIGYPF